MNQAFKNLKGIVPQQSEKPKVEKDLSQRNLWVGLLPDGLNCTKTYRKHSVQKNFLQLTLPAWAERGTVQNVEVGPPQFYWVEAG